MRTFVIVETDRRSYHFPIARPKTGSSAPMRRWLTLLTVASLLFGSMATDPSPARIDLRAVGSQGGDDSPGSGPAVLADLSQAAPLFHRKLDESAGAGPLICGGSLFAAWLSRQPGRSALVQAATAPPSRSSLPALHLRI